MQSDRPQTIGPALLADPSALGDAVVAGQVAFDDALIGAWADRARRAGVFRGAFEEARRRRAVRADGAAGRYWVQCNPGRAARRTPAVRFTSVRAPFDDRSFHFAADQIRQEEVLMRLRVDDVLVDVLVNVSPLASSHSLLVIDPGAHRPQVLDELGLGAAMGVASLSRRVDFKVGFNSLSACASVNHCHYHCFYFRGEAVDDDLMPSERAAMSAPEIGPGVHALIDHPARGWCVTPRVRGGMVRATQAIANVLIERDVAHNLVLSRERVVVIPRVHQGLVPDGVFPGLAFLEVHGEMLVVGESRKQAEQIDRTMTDEEVARQIGAIGLDEALFDALGEQAVRAIERL